MTNPDTLDAFRHRTAKDFRWPLGTYLRKRKGSEWKGQVVGFYTSSLTDEGYAIESATEKGSVQIYPANALEEWPQAMPPEKVDALEEVLEAALLGGPSTTGILSALRAELEARGMEVREKVVMTEFDLAGVERAFFAAVGDGTPTYRAAIRAGFLAAGGRLEGE